MVQRTLVRSSVLSLVLLLLLLALPSVAQTPGAPAGPAPAQPPTPSPGQLPTTKSLPARLQLGEADIVVRGAATLPKEDSAKNLVGVEGPTTIEGVVKGNVVAVKGAVGISGSVEGSVLALGGPVRVEAGGRVGRDVIAPKGAEVARDGKVEGKVVERLDLAARDIFGTLLFATKLAAWLVGSVTSLLVGLLLILVLGAGRSDALFHAGRGRSGVAAAMGLGLLIGIPVVALLAVRTIVGAPFGVMVLLALPLVLWLAYATGAWTAGRVVAKNASSAFVGFLTGWAILRIVALVPILGTLAWIVATVIGLGALAISAFPVAGSATRGSPSPRPGRPDPDEAARAAERDRVVAAVMASRTGRRPRIGG